MPFRWRDFFAGLMQGLDMTTWVQLPDGNLQVRLNSGVIQYRQGTGAWTDA
ncbi:hypothetical protein [Burkholderia sp. Bp8984]|uniref:hypothetical protein n=1 Tax=Burkholderia sp. Bp8984 TaxID=2184549 RepID=UPI0016258A54|nr:hypothetical protein [Burkholderia sp. Bp8984]